MYVQYGVSTPGFSSCFPSCKIVTLVGKNRHTILKLFYQSLKQQPNLTVTP